MTDLAVVDFVTGEIVDTTERWAERIQRAMARSVDAVVATGQTVAECKASLPHGQFLDAVRLAGMEPRAASMHLRIAENPVLANGIHGSVLPSSYRTLDVLARLEPASLEAAIEAGDVRPDMERREASELVRRVRDGKPTLREVRTATQTVPPGADHLPGVDAVYATIVADPPWKYGNAKTRNAADHKYDTLTVEELCALPVATHAAEESHLYLWTTASFLREAFDVMGSWGFAYKTNLVWLKPQMGLGNYYRVSHEHVLFGVRGGLRTLDPAKATKSWFHADRGDHSAKPDAFLDMVEQCSPSPGLEMFARRSRMTPGFDWTYWGNEA